MRNLLMGMPIHPRNGDAAETVAEGISASAVRLHQLALQLHEALGGKVDEKTGRPVGIVSHRGLLDELERLGEASRETTGDCEVEQLLKDEGKLLPLYKALSERQLTNLGQLHQSGALGAIEMGTVREVLTMNPKPWAAQVISKAQAADAAEDDRRKKLKAKADGERKKLQTDADTELAELDRSISVLAQSEFNPAAKPLLRVPPGTPLSQHIMDVLCSPEGIDAAIRRDAKNPHWPSGKDAGGALRWVLWEGSSDGREYAMALFVQAIMDIVRNGAVPRDRNGKVLPGTRGTGKSSILRCAAAAAWAFTQDGVIPECKARAVPVVVNCKVLARMFNAMEARQYSYLSSVGLVDPLAIAIDRGLQLAGERDQMDGVPPPEQQWIGDMGTMHRFLERRNLVLVLVLDEIDEIYRVSAKLSDTLASMHDGMPKVAYWLTASAAYVQPLLFRSRTQRRMLKRAGYPHDYAELHDQKLEPVTALMPMLALEEQVQAMTEFGIVDLLSDDDKVSKAIKAFNANKDGQEAREELASLLLEHGSVLRQLASITGAAVQKSRPGDVAKMTTDLSSSPAIAAALHKIALKRLGQLNPNNIVKHFAAESATKATKLPCFTANDLVAASAGYLSKSTDGTEESHELARLSDAGVIINQLSNWRIASWSAVAAICRCHNTSVLNIETRRSLESPELADSDKVTEAVLVHALHNGALGSAQLCVLKGSKPKLAEGQRLDALNRAMNVGHYPDHEKHMGTVAYDRETDALGHMPRIGEMVSIAPDKGIDGIGFFQEDDIDEEMHVTLVQAKTTGSMTAGKPNSLPGVKEIVNKMINKAPSAKALVAEAKRLNPKLAKLHIGECCSRPK